MTLFEIQNLINTIASYQPNINTICLTGDVFDINAENQAQRFGVFCIEQGTHVRQNDFMAFNFRLFYVDRLTDSSANKAIVQSTAINVLNDIINTLTDLNSNVVDLSDDITFDVFTERFEAECAGAYAQVRIKVPISFLCSSIALNIGTYKPLTFEGDFWYRKNENIQ